MSRYGGGGLPFAVRRGSRGVLDGIGLGTDAEVGAHRAWAPARARGPARTGDPARRGVERESGRVWSGQGRVRGGVWEGG